MTDFHHHDSHYSLGTKSLNYDPDNIEEAPIENLLIPLITMLKSEDKSTMLNLEYCKAEEEASNEIKKLMKTVKLLRIQFEFALGVLQCKTKKEVEVLKNKYDLKQKLYEKVKSKEDLTVLPAKYVLLLFHDKLIVELTRILQKCFKTNRSGKMQLIKSHDNISKVKILTSRFEIAEEHFAQVITFPKDDIFSLPKSSPQWQELYESVTFKNILTEREAQDSFRGFELTNYIGHVIIKNQLENGILNPKGAFCLLRDILYYGSHQRKAETFALLRFINPPLENAFDVWNLPEVPFVSLMLSFNYPIVGYDEVIYIPRLFPSITKETILREYQENSINKICPMDESNLQAPYLASTRGEVLEELFIKSETKIPIRILANDHLDLKESSGGAIKGMIRKVTRVLTGVDVSEPESASKNLDTAIIIHIHGGGFVSMSSASHRIYLIRWVKNLKMIHFCIDYRLSPQSKYPDAVDDVWQSYLWIVNYAETVLGIKNKKIIVTGDSAGGNLALALSLRLIRAGLQPPQGCLLFYPALLIDSDNITPSSFASLDETVLPTSLMKLCVKAYLGENEFQNLADPFISPLVASDELLSKLPPIRMVVGSKDPLHDYSWRFLLKLKKLNKDVKLVVHDHIRHGYLCHQDLKNYHIFMEEACDLVRELVAIES